MRVCLVYDCLYPHTVGGAERWFGALARRLARDGHEVTYLTLRQWERGADPGVPGVRVVAVGPRMGLYTESGRRRIGPPLRFGAGVLWHLLRHGANYDVVHTVAFPYFSLLAAAVARPLRGFGLLVDWFEVWTAAYWREYLGPVGGRAGHAVQRRCACLRQRAFCFSRLHAERLEQEGLRGAPAVLSGIYEGPSVAAAAATEPATDTVVFAGRHIREKRVPELVHAIARAREQAPALRGEIYGDGPEREAVLRAVAECRLDGVVDVPGFVPGEQVAAALARALCLALPSRREGYGLVVVEAAALATPSVVVSDPDNAATELIEEGANGYVARSADAGELAAAILRVRDRGVELRVRTAAWFERNAQRLSLEGSLETVAAAYRELSRGNPRS